MLYRNPRSRDVPILKGVVGGGQHGGAIRVWSDGSAGLAAGPDWHVGPSPPAPLVGICSVGWQLHEGVDGLLRCRAAILLGPETRNLRFRIQKEVIGNVVTVHGRMQCPDKEETMQQTFWPMLDEGMS